MSFLKSIEKYASKYKSILKLHNYRIISKQDGPGMGAIIKFYNDILYIDLINDRDEYFVDIGINNNTYSLALLLAISIFTDNGYDILKLTKAEKEKMWSINYDYKDPLKVLFDNYEGILRVSRRSNSNLLCRQSEAYYKDRGNFLFPTKK